MEDIHLPCPGCSLVCPEGLWHVFSLKFSIKNQKIISFGSSAFPAELLRGWRAETIKRSICSVYVDIVIAAFVPFLTNCIMPLPCEPLEGPEGIRWWWGGAILTLVNPRGRARLNRELPLILYTGDWDGDCLCGTHIWMLSFASEQKAVISLVFRVNAMPPDLFNNCPDFCLGLDFLLSKCCVPQHAPPLLTKCLFDLLWAASTAWASVLRLIQHHRLPFVSMLPLFPLLSPPLGIEKNNRGF